MPVEPKDVHEMAFKTRWGFYKFLFMPFGVTNVPGQFMNIVNDLHDEYLNKFIVFFLDGVLIYSANTQDDAKHLRKILGKLKKHQLFAMASKCEILRTSMEFLGQQTCRGGMTPTKAKLKAVRYWATQEDVKGV